VQATVGSGGGGTVSVSPASPDGFYTQGTLVSITATPAAGFAFLRWDAAGSTSALTADRANPAVFTVNTPNLPYIADFTRAAFATISSNIPALKATVDGQLTYLPAGFAWAAGSTHTIKIQDASSPRAQPGCPTATCFRTGANGGATTQTITAAAASTTIGATWKRQFLVSDADPLPGLSGFNGGMITMSPLSKWSIRRCGRLSNCTKS